LPGRCRAPWRSWWCRGLGWRRPSRGSPNRTLATAYSRTVRSAPHPPDGRSRTKAPAACWGFRLSLSPEILAGALRSAPAGFEMIALNVLG
jgi:hypothetical protein